MSEKITVTIEDNSLIPEVDNILNDLGISKDTVITMLFKSIIHYHGIPDSLVSRQINNETLLAIIEAEQISKNPQAKTYSNVKELMEDLKS